MQDRMKFFEYCQIGVLSDKAQHVRFRCGGSLLLLLWQHSLVLCVHDNMVGNHSPQVINN